MYFYDILCFGSHHQDTATEPRRWLSPQDASLLSLLSLMESMFSMLQLLCAVDLVLEEVEVLLEVLDAPGTEDSTMARLVGHSPK